MKKPETKNIEYKAAINFKEWKKWLKTFCGFANSSGGKILFGYNDNGEFVGFPENEIDGYIRHINQIVRNHTYPLLPINVEYASEKDGYIGIQIQISKRSKCLNWLIDNNKTPELYIRYEGETQIATPEEMQDLLMMTNKYEYDSISVGKPMDNVSFDELEEIYSKNNNGEIITSKMLKSFNLITENDELTLAGYLFCDNTDYNDANIVCNTWPSNTKGTREIEDTKIYRGSIIYLINEIIKYIKNVRYYNFGAIKKDLFTQEDGSFSINSLREAVVNAFAHRDYQIRGNEIQVNCFPDRIEITSPGSSLIGNNQSEFKRLESFPSHRRNKTICNILSKCRLMDEKGSGFDAILNDYSKFSENYQPLYKSDRVSFTLILKNKKKKAVETTIKTTIINYHNNELMFKNRAVIFGENNKFSYIEQLIQQNNNITLDEIAENLNITRDGAKYYISKMKNACLIKRTGSPKYGYYELIADIDRPSAFESLPNDIKDKVVEWCKRNFTMVNGFNVKQSSYGLKHIYERVEGTYLTNGQFKGAMILAGFKCKDISEKNWHFNISEKSSALKMNLER